MKGSGVIFRLSQPFLEEPEGPLLCGHVRRDPRHPYIERLPTL